VQVLEDDEAPSSTGELADQVDRGPHALVGGTSLVADHPGQLGPLSAVGPVGSDVGAGDGVEPQGVEEQRQRAPVAVGVGLPGEQRRPGRHPGDQLLDEAGLADPGFAGQQRHRGLRAGSQTQRLLQSGELCGSSDHHGREACPGNQHQCHDTAGRGALFGDVVVVEVAVVAVLRPRRQRRSRCVVRLVAAARSSSR
jgi:hypothetical protein